VSEAAELPTPHTFTFRFVAAGVPMKKGNKTSHHQQQQQQGGRLAWPCCSLSLSAPLDRPSLSRTGLMEWCGEQNKRAIKGTHASLALLANDPYVY